MDGWKDGGGGPAFAKPRSLVVFLAGTAIAMLFLAPLAFSGWHFESIPLFLAGTAAFAIVSLVAAFMGLRFTAALAAGHYRTLQPRPWREQVW